MITLTSQQDDCVFERSLRGEGRQFEGAGAASTWRIEIPQNAPAPDMDSLMDLVLHMRYTAREAER